MLKKRERGIRGEGCTFCTYVRFTDKNVVSSCQVNRGCGVVGGWVDVARG